MASARRGRHAVRGRFGPGPEFQPGGLERALTFVGGRRRVSPPNGDWRANSRHEEAAGVVFRASPPRPRRANAPGNSREFAGRNIARPGQGAGRRHPAGRSGLMILGPARSGKTRWRTHRALHRPRSCRSARSPKDRAGPRDHQEAEERAQLNGRRTILFCDEIHRFNKGQRDAFCRTSRRHHRAVGATTETPVRDHRALLSRCRCSCRPPLWSRSPR